MPSNDHRLRFFVAVVITVIWAASFIADILVMDYDPPAFIGAAMLVVAGALFGEGIVGKVKRTPEKINE